MPKPNQTSIEKLVTQAQKKAAEKIFADALSDELKVRMKMAANDLVRKWIKANLPRLSRIVSKQLTREVEVELLKRAKSKLRSTKFHVYIDED